MGFDAKWCAWLQTCWRTTSCSILFNGLAGKIIKCSRGLRQGDPLLSLVSVLAVKIWTQLKAQNLGCIFGFKVSNCGQGFPILQFAYDTLIMIDGFVEEARTV